MIVGFSPTNLTDTVCGSALHPSGACGGRLDFKFDLSIALFVTATVALAIGLALSKLSPWRACLCFAGVVGVPLFTFIAMSALTHEPDASLYCGGYLSQPKYQGDPEFQAAQDQACGPFRSRQLRLAAATGLAAVVSAGAIGVAVRLGRRPARPPPFREPALGDY